MTTTPDTRTLEVPGAILVYDVRGPLPTADGRPPLLAIGQPMDASGFGTLASHFRDRTFITYDPRGLGRSTRHDGATENRPEQQADDVHALVVALGVGPVDLFGSSGGAVTALHLAATYPDDVRVVVAHEPPLIGVLPDADRALAGFRAVEQAYQDKGWGAGMAAFIGYTSWQGEFPAEPLEAPDPAAFGMPADDDGSRTDPLLSGASTPVVLHQLDLDALRALGDRVVIAAGEESRGTFTWRTAEALAAALGAELAVFPSNHGGFLGDEFGMPGQPEAFAARLREVLPQA